MSQAHAPRAFGELSDAMLEAVERLVAPGDLCSPETKPKEFQVVTGTNAAFVDVDVQLQPVLQKPLDVFLLRRELLRDGLLDDAIRHVRNTQWPLATI